MAPILPGLSDDPAKMADVVRAARDAGATSIWTNVLYLRPGTREHFLDNLARDWPELLPRYERLYAGRAYVAKDVLEPVRTGFAHSRASTGSRTAGAARSGHPPNRNSSRWPGSWSPRRHPRRNGRWGAADLSTVSARSPPAVSGAPAAMRYARRPCPARRRQRTSNRSSGQVAGVMAASPASGLWRSAGMTLCSQAMTTEPSDLAALAATRRVGLGLQEAVVDGDPE